MLVGDQSDIIEFLRASAAASGTGPAEIIETHISIIVLGPERVWKLKRAVRLPYADFSTPERRTAACEHEVALNRRTAPELYLGVRRITRGHDGRLAFDAPGELADAVVEMRRFDQNTLFSELARAGRLDRPTLTALARNIARFHAAAQSKECPHGAANIADILELNEQNTALPAMLGEQATHALRGALRDALARHRDVLDARARAGKIRHCHGDLHLRNLCLIDGHPTLFDCIEFNDALATSDVLYDLAFLLMDLWHAGLPAEANWVMNRYLDDNDETDGLALLPFFMALRASIRAQVLATQAELPDSANRAALVDEANGYLNLATQFLQPATPCLLAIGGLSGSGKSTVAAAIAHRLGAAPGARVLATDRIRKQLAGVPAETRLPKESYTREASERVYATLYERTLTTLGANTSVIADAVFSRPEERQAIADCAARAGTGFQGVWLDAPPETLLPRVQARRNDPSDASIDVVQLQLARGTGAIDWATIPAGGDLAATAEAVLAVALTPSWSQAPEGFNWLAQDADGRWFWFAVAPQMGVAGGVWRSPRRAQRFAGQGVPNPLWYESCRQRPTQAL